MTEKKSKSDGHFYFILGQFARRPFVLLVQRNPPLPSYVSPRAGDKRKTSRFSSACSRGFASSLNFYTPLEKVYLLLPFSLNLFLLGDLLCTSPCAVTKTFPRCIPQVISVSFGFLPRQRQRRSTRRVRQQFWRRASSHPLAFDFSSRWRINLSRAKPGTWTRTT